MPEGNKMKPSTIGELNLQLIAILLVTIGHVREKNRVLTEEEMAFKLGIAPSGHTAN